MDQHLQRIYKRLLRQREIEMNQWTNGVPAATNGQIDVSFQEINKMLCEFALVRQWNQYGSPRNLR